MWQWTHGTAMGCQVAYACGTVGHGRVMFGIDSACHDPTGEIQEVMAGGGNDEGLENIFYNNAGKFMGLK